MSPEKESHAAAPLHAHAPPAFAPGETLLLYRDGRIYDAIIRSDLGDVEFLRALVLRRPGPALELACGTGRLMIPWARAGREVTGLDSSAVLLERAQANAAQAGAHVRTIAADMRRFALGSRFDSIVLGGDSVGHLHDEDALRDCLSSVRVHLAEGGAFIIDVSVPESRLLSADPSERFHWGRYVDAAGETVDVSFNASYAEATGLLTLRIRAVSSAGSRDGGRLALRMWRPQELERALSASGFDITERFGNYRGDPPRARSPRCIFICVHRWNADASA